MSHMQDYAHHVVSRHGPLHVGEIYGSYVGAEWQVPGATIEDQRDKFRAEVAADERLSVDDETGMVALTPRKDRE